MLDAFSNRQPGIGWALLWCASATAWACIKCPLTPLPLHSMPSCVSHAGLDMVAPAPEASIDLPWLVIGSCYSEHGIGGPPAEGPRDQSHGKHTAMHPTSSLDDRSTRGCFRSHCDLRLEITGRWLLTRLALEQPAPWALHPRLSCILSIGTAVRDE